MNSDFLDEDTIVYDQNGEPVGQSSPQDRSTVWQGSSRQGSGRQAAGQSTSQTQAAPDDFSQDSENPFGPSHYRPTEGIRILLEGNDALKNQISNSQALQSYVHSKNKLLNACAEMLSMCVVVTRIPKPDDLHQHQQVLKDAISDLKHRIAALDYPPSVADKTCFLFCVVLDEFIMHCDWGEDCGWENHTLLSELFGMRNGGEQFFQVTEKALRQPNQLMDWLELVYIFLKMGFRGQYRLRGREKLDALMHQLELLLNPHRKAASMTPLPPVELPSVRKPHRRARFGGQLVVFLMAIVLIWGGASFWYQNTLEQRARSFITLPEFSWNYFNVGHDTEFVYDSTEEEMERAIKLYGKPTEQHEEANE
ncbi:type IVB secretion system protein IcmH/DotU [Litoribacillus peritrichatus]|uniref:Type IV / VI secretion system DotU domain-containing protein n=1 Tax=Litoribacillus peritrichatus TaxID=718191 RepID=A0ABP7MIK1_9GAMM